MASPGALDSRRGWVVAWAAFLSMFTVFAVGYSFGAFFDPLVEDFGSSSSATALIFSATISLSFLFGLQTGRWVDRVGPKPVLLAGAASLTIGLFAMGLVGSLLVGYLVYSTFVGFAIACGYVPLVATVGGWFEKQRAAALGLAVSGIGAGTLVGAPTAAKLIELTSWRTTYLILGIAGGGLLLLAAFLAEIGPAAVASEQPKSIVQLMKVREFRLLYFAVFSAVFGIFVPLVFVATYAEQRGITEVKAATLVGLIGGSSVIGRLGLGAIADRIGSYRLFVASFVVMMLSHSLWLVADDRYWMLVTYTVVLGLGYGGFIVLGPAVAANLFGLDGLGGVLGTLYTSAGGGSLLGPPIAGLLFDSLGSSAAILFAMAMGLCSTIAISQLHRTPRRVT